MVDVKHSCLSFCPLILLRSGDSIPKLSGGTLLVPAVTASYDQPFEVRIQNKSLFTSYCVFRLGNFEITSRTSPCISVDIESRYSLEQL